MKIQDLYSIYLQYPIVSTDSRKVQSKSLFFALKGDNFNGNAYAHIAIENGAEYAIIDELEYKKSDKFILVDNVLTTLQQLANYHRLQFSIPVIGITGTNGKTTTKELINSVLSEKYFVCCTQGNLNNHIGVPLTLLTLTNKHEIAIIEMGANHMGEIAELCKIAIPTYGIITNIGKAHLEGFGSYENIIKTKSELYNFIALNKGTVFYNADDTLLKELSTSLSRVAYGSNRNCRVSGFLHEGTISAKGNLTINNSDIPIQSNLYGEYNFINILAAACVGSFFEVSEDKIKHAIENYHPSNNRSQIYHSAHNELILDAYNANPSSMFLSISHFISLNASKKAVILGEMRELGEKSVEEHARIAELVTKSNISLIIFVGNWGASCLCRDNIFLFENVEKLNLWLKTHILKDYKILVKGSRGIKLEKCVEFL